MKGCANDDIFLRCNIINYVSFELLISVITTLISAILVLLTFVQLYKSMKIKKAEFINGLLDDIRLNDRCSKALHYIDYNIEWYNSKFHKTSEIESIMDDFLSKMD